MEIREAIRDVCDFMCTLNIEELLVVWRALFPDIPVADDYKTMVTMVVCKILERKCDISDEANKKAAAANENTDWK